MADALLSLVTDLLKQLGSLAVQQAQQEINLIVGVEEEIEKLSNSFKIVQAMLNDAEERQWTEAAVTLWLDQLRDVYYMMDDVLDKWNTARIKSEIQKEEERAVTNNNPAALKKKVPCSFFPSLSCCFRQVDNLSLRREIGHKVENLKQTLDNILKDKVTYGFDLTRHSHVEVERPTTTSFVDVSDIIGRDDYRDELLSKLLGASSQEERNPRVMSLVGMGGIGKSTLAQLAYNHHEIQAHFQQKIWVCVSDPFDQCKVAKAIIESIEGQSPNITELQSLLAHICDLIGGKKFFLVLDDVWTKEFTKWEPFKNALKCGVQGSRILVTTRKDSVAKMMESSHTINLGVLSLDDCWSMFSKIAFPNEDLHQHRDLEELGKKLANKCKGLPLAAKTLGSHMRGKRSKEQWEKVLHNSLWEVEDVEKGLLGPLLLSYNELSLSEKQCFLFCVVYEKDHQYNRLDLIIHWMAQGYIHSKGKKEMEDIAEEYFEKLAMCSFFQDFKKDENDDRITSCKMHDIVHDFAQLMTRDVCSTIEGEEEVKIDFKRAQHLSLIVKEIFPESVYEAKNLRTLFLLSHERDYEFNMHLSNSCHHFRCLRTLILDCPITKLPDAVENLIHLRCLHIYENVKIEEFPETLCNLCNLQTLNIDNYECFKRLPREMGKLINLRQLRFNTNYFSWYKLRFPNGIGKLTCLRTLSDFNICGKDDKEGCKLGELKNLNQLRGSFKMHGLGNVVDVGEAQNAQLKKKIHLHDLELDFWVEGQNEEEGEESRRRMESDVAVLNALEPPPHLEKLSIGRVIGTTVYTNWMTSLTNLKSLDINWCCQLECLPPLGKLPLLKELNIVGAINVKKLGDEFLGIESENKSKKDDCHIINIFPNLRVLVIEVLGSCEEWIGMGGKRIEEVEEEKDSRLVSDPIIKIMPRLHSLTIEDCNKLKCLPDYLRTTPLQELIIQSCPILGQRCEKDYWPIISHIPTIKIDFDHVQINGQRQFGFRGSESEEDGSEYESDEQVEEDIDEGDS
ncbi:putative disease resistance protein RGA3 [Quercus suber]|uniref:putative disease resistance protein RGA3 n=1 Tax=Quercus suber TaxID=58331 RepID=UPI0032DF9377